MNKFLHSVTAVALLFGTVQIHAQAPTLGTAASFALFSTTGAVSNTGLSHLTGNVGTNNGPNNNFGNVDGVMHNANGTTATAAADLTLAYNQLDATIPNFFPAPLLGNGATLNAGTYFINQSATLNNNLTLDAQGNANAVFIFQIEGAFSSGAGAQVLLTNGALACNVFWKVEGLVNLATNTSMKGTIIASQSAIVFGSGASLEGRALSTTGAITVAGVTVRTPIGCGSPVLTGPAAPPLNTVLCYTVFSGSGAVVNTGVSFVTGDVGTNVGLTTGFQAENVTGTIHANPDVSTAQCAADLTTVYTYLNTLPADIQLLYPAAFGQDLVLTPHTYLMDAATVLTGKVILNAQNNPDAVFVIKINGALSTGTYATIELINGAQAKNVFWKIDGATSLNNYANFKGTVIGNGGAINLNIGAQIEGRVLTTVGDIATAGINAEMTIGCDALGIDSNTSATPMAQFYPNPFSSMLNISFTEGGIGSKLTIYNVMGATVLEALVSQQTTEIPMDVASGMYYYKIVSENGAQQAGKLLAK